MAKGSIKVGDTVAVTATVRKRVTEDRVSVLILSHGQPHSIVDGTPHVSCEQKIELTAEVDDDTVADGGKDLGSYRTNLCLDVQFGRRADEPKCRRQKCARPSS